MGPTSIKNITNVIKYNQTVGLKLPINSSLDGNNHLHQLLYTGKNKNLLKFVSQTVFDPSRFYLYKNISDGRVLSINWLHPTLEPSVASNGSSILLTGNHFVTKSTDGGLHWTQMNYSQDFSHNRLQILNNGGDNDVIYSNRIHKFIWYRQGQDGRFNLAVSPDLNRWNFHILVEANNLIPQLNLDTILSQNSLGPRGNCTNEDTPECSVNFWFDFPRLALSDSHLYISTNVFLGCGISGLTNPSCGAGGLVGYGSVVFRVLLDDLNRENVDTIVNQQYFQQPDHYYYAANDDAPALSQGARSTMYWASHAPPTNVERMNTLSVCKWDDGSNSPTCQLRQIETPFSGGRISCPANDNRDWCWYDRNRIGGAWVYHGKLGFIWNVVADPLNATLRNYPFPWLKASRVSNRSHKRKCTELLV